MIDDEPKGGYGQAEKDPERFKLLEAFDFPEDLKGGNIVLYNTDKLTLYDIFDEYGTEAKPAVDPKNDPEPPKPKEKSELKSPVKKVEVPPPKEEEAKEGEGAEGAEDPESSTKVEEVEEPEEVFIPPVEKVLWYDFDAYDGKDPVLLALMRIDLEEKSQKWEMKYF